MTTQQPQNTSQDYDRKHHQDHILKNPRAADDKGSSINPNEIKQYPKEDKRKVARAEHTHFTNRHDSK